MFSVSATEEFRQTLFSESPVSTGGESEASVQHAAEETTRYQTLEGALACLIEDFSLSGIRSNPDQPSLFNVHQS